VRQENFNGFRFVAYNPRKAKGPPSMYNTQQTMVFFRMLTDDGVDALNALREAKARMLAGDHVGPEELKKLFGSGMDIHTQVCRVAVSLFLVLPA
jgi:hypothetical protein